MIIGLASPRAAASLDDGLEKVGRLLADAAAQRRGDRVLSRGLPSRAARAGLSRARRSAGRSSSGRCRPWRSWRGRTAWPPSWGWSGSRTPGRRSPPFVIDAQGRIAGCQTKNQLDPSEDPFYVPGNTRQLFEIGGLRFGVAICHEGWRYPETVRWAAVRGAHIVFHPQLTGTHAGGVRMTEWGAAGGPYYEKAMMMRSRENTIYFASVNYALPFPESATSLIAPSGECQAYLPYGEEGVLVQRIDLAAATGLLATRYAPERYPEAAAE